MDMSDEPGADLHSHSRFSDGLFTPAEVVDRAVAAGLEALALTDHDCLDGLEAAAAASRGRLRLIAGIEISCRHETTDVHLLGWFLDPAHQPLRLRLEELVQARERRLDLILQKLSQAGVGIDADDVRARSAGRVTGRPHVAATMVAAGHAHSMDDAFGRWLGRGRPGFVPLDRLAAAEAVRLVKNAGGVAGIAHPGLGVPDRVIESLASAGAAGLEVDHPAHSRSQRRHYRALAERLGLAASAGSDFHGDRERHADVGGERLAVTGLQALESRRL